METAIPGAIIIGLLLLAALMMSEQILSSQDAVSESWREMQERVKERARTDLSPVEAQTTSGGAYVEVTLTNDGDTRLADFDQWDVILQYTGDDGLHIEWYPYVEPGDFGLWQDEWTHNILSDVFDPDILNPGEKMVVRISPDPPVSEDTTNRATVATPNGITASTVFTR